MNCIFIVSDILKYICNFLSYNDKYRILRISSQVYNTLSVYDHYNMKTEYLKNLGINHELFAKVCRGYDYTPGKQLTEISDVEVYELLSSFKPDKKYLPIILCILRKLPRNDYIYPFQFYNVIGQIGDTEVLKYIHIEDGCDIGYFINAAISVCNQYTLKYALSNWNTDVILEQIINQDNVPSYKFVLPYLSTPIDAIYHINQILKYDAVDILIYILEEDTFKIPKDFIVNIGLYPIEIQQKLQSLLVKKGREARISGYSTKRKMYVPATNENPN